MHNAITLIQSTSFLFPISIFSSNFQLTYGNLTMKHIKKYEEKKKKTKQKTKTCI